MTEDEVDTFITSFSGIGDGWDMRCIVGAYRHLSLKDAISSYMRDLKKYCKQCEAEVKEPPRCEYRIQ